MDSRIPPGMERDLRVCFLGDSFVAGVGDPDHLGWVGRIVARSHANGTPLTTHNLGVRGQTSAQVLARWWEECAPRLLAGGDNRLVTSFGVNDTTYEQGAPRVAPKSSAEHLAQLLAQATERSLRVLVVGPAPVADEQQNARTVALDALFQDVCREHGVDYVTIIADLLKSRCWMDQIQSGDGAHPGAAGYQEAAELIYPTWALWLADPF